MKWTPFVVFSDGKVTQISCTSPCTFWKINQNFSKWQHLRFIDFSQKTKKFIGNTWKCLVSIGLTSYSETKASSVGISKIFFDLNGLDPPREEPSFSKESFITLETTLLRCAHPQLCRHSPFCFQISRNYKKQLYFSGPPTLCPGREGRLTSCLFLPAFLSISSVSLSLFDCIVFNERSLRKFFRRMYQHISSPLVFEKRFEIWACCQRLPRRVDPPAPLRFCLFWNGVCGRCRALLPPAFFFSVSSAARCLNRNYQKQKQKNCPCHML